MTASLAAIAGQMPALARRFLAWWLGELAALVPPFLRRLSLAPRRSLVIDVRDDGVAIGQRSGRAYRPLARLAGQGILSTDDPVPPPDLPAHIRRQGAPVVLRLPADQALTRVVAYPLAAEPELRQIIANDIDRQLPYPAERVHHDYRILGRDSAAQRLTVELAVIERAAVERALAIARQWGLSPAAVSLIGEDGADNEFDFIREQESSAGSRRLVNTNGVLATLAVVLAVLCVYGAIETLSAADSLLAQEAARAKAQAQGVDQLQKEIDKAARHGGFLAGKRQAVPAIGVLAEVTRILPDDSWLYSLQIAGKEVRIAGFSPDVSGLLAAFEDSALFEAARFRSPLTKGPGGQVDRFDLSFEIKARKTP